MTMSKKTAWILLTPALTIMVLVAVYPILYAIYLSVTNAHLTDSSHSQFVGLNNYQTIFSDHYFWQSLSTTLLITVISVTIEFVLGMAIALVMRSTTVLPTVLRTCVLVPYGVVTAVSAYSWLYAWTPRTGYLANLITPEGAPLSHHASAIAVICGAEVWKTTPFLSLILLSGMALIPSDTLTAAQLDGANAWERLVHIIIPLIKPSIAVGLLFRIADALRIFDNIYILTRGNNTTFSLSILGYDNLFQTFNVGLGSAISIVIVFVVLFICLSILKVLHLQLPGTPHTTS